MTHHHLLTVPDRSTPPVLAYPDRACKDVDPDLFFPGPGGTGADAAKAICLRCEHVTECREWAVATEQEFGIWGATAPEDRRRIREATAEEPAPVRPPEPEVPIPLFADSDFARVVLDLLGSAGLTARRLADRLGINAEQVIGWRCGRRTPSTRSMIQLAVGCGRHLALLSEGRETVRLTSVAELPLAMLVLRGDSGLTQAEVGERLAEYQSRISSWESGKTGPRLVALIALAAVYGYTVALIPMEDET